MICSKFVTGTTSSRRPCSRAKLSIISRSRPGAEPGSKENISGSSSAATRTRRRFAEGAAPAGRRAVVSTANTRPAALAARRMRLGSSIVPPRPLSCPKGGRPRSPFDPPGPSKQGPDQGAKRSVSGPPPKARTSLHQVGDRGQERLGELIDPWGGEMAGVDEEGGVGEPLVDEHAVDAVAGDELHEEGVVAGQDGRVGRPGAEWEVPGPESDARVEVLPELLVGSLGVGGREGGREVGDAPLSTAPVHLLEAPEGSPDVGLQHPGVEAEQPLEEQAVVEAPAPRVPGGVTGEVEPRDVVDGLVLNDHVRVERQELVQPPQPILAVDAAHLEVLNLGVSGVDSGGAAWPRGARGRSRRWCARPRWWSRRCRGPVPSPRASPARTPGCG